MRYQTTFNSPLGPIVAITEDNAITALYIDEPVQESNGRHVDACDHEALRALRDQLERYWKGEAVTFDVPLRPKGTAFQTRVWKALEDIPYGHTISYGELARRIGQPTAVRAVGRANGVNPIPIVIPCHRVIGGNGSLVGYAGGLDRKRTLLLLEGALDAPKTQRLARAGVGQV